jgi:hypothetical protein
MSYEIIIDDESVGDIASATGWGQFRDWAISLPIRFEEVIRFAEHGLTSKPATLRTQLLDAIQQHEPRKATVAEIAGELARMIQDSKTTDENGVIVLTDGT